MTRTMAAFVSVSRAAALLSYHPETIRRFIHEGRIPEAFRLTPRSPWRIPMSAIKRLKSQQVPTSSSTA